MTTTRSLLTTFALAAAVSVSSCSISESLAKRDPRGDRVTRELPWEGSATLIVGVPAQVRFVQAPGPGKVVVTGPRRSVRSFTVANGVLDDATFRTGGRLEIVVTAPKVEHFYVKGGDTLTIEDFDQEQIHIEAIGRADVKAAGRAGTVHLNLLGFGWADLSQLETTGAEIALTGFRNAIVAPRDWVKISGQGDVILTTSPAQISKDPAGGGRVIRAQPRTATAASTRGEQP